MKSKLLRFFLYSAGGLLLATAVAKFISISGTAEMLRASDPILRIPFRSLFWIAGISELAVALLCLFGKSLRLRAGLVAFLATNLMVYRVCVWMAGYRLPCNCLGDLTAALHISPDVADHAMKAILVYLLIGSYAALLWLRKPGGLDPVTLRVGGVALK